jgi:cobalt-zinc-cadmium efflux system outer membrane protein
MQALYESLGIAEADLVEAGLLSNPVFDAEIRFFRGTADPSAEVNLLQNVVNIFFLPL